MTEKVMCALASQLVQQNTWGRNSGGRRKIKKSKKLSILYRVLQKSSDTTGDKLFELY